MAMDLVSLTMPPPPEPRFVLGRLDQGLEKAGAIEIRFAPTLDRR